MTIGDTTAGRFGYVYDPHGSVSLLLDQANVVKKSYGYSGYGGAIGSVTKNAAGFADPNRYQYTGKRWDTATGSYDIGLRRYTPASSRWLQQDLYYDALANLDLSADPLLANRYMFAGANPVNFVEIDGHVLAKDDEMTGTSQFALAVMAQNEAEETRALWADGMSCSKAEQKRGECKPLLKKIVTVDNMQQAAVLLCRIAQEPRVRTACWTIVGGKNLAIDMTQCAVERSKKECTRAVVSTIQYYCQIARNMMATNRFTQTVCARLNALTGGNSKKKARR